MNDADERTTWTRRLCRAAPPALAMAMAMAGAQGCTREVILGSLPDGAGGSAGDDDAGTGATAALPAARCPSGEAPVLSTIASDLHTEVTGYHPGIPLFLRGETLYFATPTAVMTVPLAGGPTTTLTTEPDPFQGGWPVDIKADATTVYVATETGIATVPATGGVMTEIVSSEPLIDGSPSVSTQIALDADDLYWVGVRNCTDADGCFGTVGEMKRMPLGGGAPTLLCSDAKASLLGGPWGGLTLAGDDVYWVNENSGWVMKVPRAGGEAVAIATLQAGVSPLASDAASVYWVTNPDWGVDLGLMVKKAPLDGSAVVTLETLPAKNSLAAGVAVNETGLYWGDAFYGPGTNDSARPKGTRVRMDSLAGGAPREVVTLEGVAPAGGFISCPGGVCWVMADLAKPAATSASILRIACP